MYLVRSRGGGVVSMLLGKSKEITAFVKVQTDVYLNVGGSIHGL